MGTWSEVLVLVLEFEGAAAVRTWAATLREGSLTGPGWRSVAKSMVAASLYVAVERGLRRGRLGMKQGLSCERKTADRQVTWRCRQSETE